MINTEPVAALVVAAGSGVRLGGSVTKALRLLDGEPLVVHALRRLAAGGVSAAVVVTRPQDREDMALAVAMVPELPTRLVDGGAERQDSVHRGLQALLTGTDSSHARVVLVHDAARALVDPETVARVIQAVRAGSAAVVPVVPVVDSIRQVAPDGASTAGVDRTTLLAVQTPQGFDRDTLVEAHRRVAEDGIVVTDDAGACEHLGVAVTTVPGSPYGIKITEPRDLLVAEAILAEFAKVDRPRGPVLGQAQGQESHG